MTFWIVSGFLSAEITFWIEHIRNISVLNPLYPTKTGTLSIRIDMYSITIEVLLLQSFKVVDKHDGYFIAEQEAP